MYIKKWKSVFVVYIIIYPWKKDCLHIIFRKLKTRERETVERFIDITYYINEMREREGEGEREAAYSVKPKLWICFHKGEINWKSKNWFSLLYLICILILILSIKLRIIRIYSITDNMHVLHVNHVAMFLYIHCGVFSFFYFCAYNNFFLNI